MISQFFQGLENQKPIGCDILRTLLQRQDGGEPFDPRSPLEAPLR